MKSPPSAVPTPGLCCFALLLSVSLPDAGLAQFTPIQMPVAGYVSIEYDSASRLNSPIPPFSHVTVRHLGRILPDTGVIVRLADHTTQKDEWCPCSKPGEEEQRVVPGPVKGCDPATRHTYGRASRGYTWKVGAVFPGEIIELTCSTLAPSGAPIRMNLSGMDDPDTVGVTLVWSGFFETPFSWYCDPKVRLVERVYVSLVFTPDTVVRFAALDSHNVYPYYPAIRNDTVTSGVKKRYMDLQARIAHGDSILRNYPIRVEKPVLVDSGGHSHNGARPMGTYRIPKVSGIGFDTVNTFFVRSTDSTGVLRFRFLASQFGGGERIKARTVSDTTKFDTLRLLTRVPGLVSLEPGPHYELIGSPNNHSGTNDPCRGSPPTSRHFQNHYGTARLSQMIQEIADAYWSLHPGIRLRFNDMSVANGGLFDASENEPPPHARPWLPPHREHRIGVNADIGYKGINTFNQCVDIDTLDIQIIIWQKTKKEPLNHRPPGPPAPHFHIYVRED